ncbi:hypothetical protein VTH82DRAFT_1413 [Thermothelomyces myriococcoides]
MAELDLSPLKLRDTLDWPNWYKKLESKACTSRIWRYFNPDSDSDLEAKYPWALMLKRAKEELVARARAWQKQNSAATLATSESTTPTVKSSTNDNEIKPTKEEIEKYLDKLWDCHKFLVMEYNELGKSISRLGDWVSSTVDTNVY